MPKFKPQYRRLLFIDRKIREGHFPNCNSLAREWEVSTKTIHRDICYMKWELGAPLDYDSERHGYFYTEANYNMPAMSISESDLFAICIAEKALEQYKHTPLHSRLAAVFEKIQGSLPKEVSVHPSWVDSRVSFLPEPSTTIDPDVWHAVTMAVRDNRTLRVHHQTADGPANTSPRDLDPYHLVSYRGQWYVIAFCHRSSKMRTFALSRMSNVELLQKRFEIPEDFSIDKLLGSHFGIMWSDQEYHVSIRFAKRLAPYIVEREWHPSQTVKTNKDGSVVLSFTTNHINEVKDWVMSWGAGARVLAPRPLVEKVRSEFHAGARLYGK